jgi:hypothetical protein
MTDTAAASGRVSAPNITARKRPATSLPPAANPATIPRSSAWRAMKLAPCSFGKRGSLDRSGSMGDKSTGGVRPNI